MKKTSKKNNNELAEEWNKIAHLRHTQIVEKQDLSYHNILIPSIEKLLLEDALRRDKSSLLDVGCGTGYLSHILANSFKKVVGIDISKESIQIAKNEFGNTANLFFENSSVEKFYQSNKNLKNVFQVVVANMTLMDVSDLGKVLEAISKLLSKDGVFIFTITHPFYWSKYWNYDNADWFNYKEEIFIEAPFKISLDESSIMTSHIHRPLEMYIKLLNQNNLQIVDLLEPMPDSITNKLYPKKWEFPRFMTIKCKVT